MRSKFILVLLLLFLPFLFNLDAQQVKKEAKTEEEKSTYTGTFTVTSSSSVRVFLVKEDHLKIGLVIPKRSLLDWWYIKALWEGKPTALVDILYHVKEEQKPVDKIPSYQLTLRFDPDFAGEPELHFDEPAYLFLMGSPLQGRDFWLFDEEGRAIEGKKHTLKENKRAPLKGILQFDYHQPLLGEMAVFKIHHLGEMVYRKYD